MIKIDIVLLTQCMTALRKQACREFSGIDEMWIVLHMYNYIAPIVERSGMRPNGDEDFIKAAAELAATAQLFRDRADPWVSIYQPKNDK